MAISAGPHREPRSELSIARAAIPGGAALCALAVFAAPTLDAWFGPVGTALAALSGLVGAILFVFGVVALGLWLIDRR